MRRSAPKAETAFDLWSTGVTPHGQAIAHFRAQLDAQRVIAGGAACASMPNHLVCRVGGLVITRQRPGTAKGFVFLTLEDETGLVNVIVRPDVYERYRRVIRTSSMLVIEGVLQKEQGTIDLLARAHGPSMTKASSTASARTTFTDHASPLSASHAS